MMRWNSSALGVLAVRCFLLASLASALRFHARHNGQSHNNHLHNRQNYDMPNGPAGGIGVISIPIEEIPLSTPPSEVIKETFAATQMGVPELGPSVTLLSEHINASVTSKFQAPTFPITVIQIPVYTICPDTPGSLDTSKFPTFKGTAGHPNVTAKDRAIGDTSIGFLSYFPIPVNATAILSNGSTTTFLSQRQSLLSTTSATGPPAPSTTSPSPNARIVLGNNGCQTLFVASTTQICSTVLSRGGEVAITVTDCSQWVTFSSSLAGVTRVASACDSGETSADVLAPALAAATEIPASVDMPTLVATNESSNSVPVTADTALSAEGRSERGNMTYFAAAWYEIAAGVVPGLVKVETCAVGSVNLLGTQCVAGTERWSISTATSVTTRMKKVDFSGPVIFTYNSQTLTTTVTYASVHTTESTVLIPTIVRQVLLPITQAPTIPAGKTVIVQITVPIETQTFHLLHGEPDFGDDPSTMEEHRTVTVTVNGTVVRRVTSVAQGSPSTEKL